MALHGTLDEFQVEGILRMLDWSASTGVLHIEAADREASIWVRQGSCVWASTDMKRDALAPADAMLDAVFELSLAHSGLFRFHSCQREELRPPDSAARKIRDVLKEVAEQRATWTRALSHLPDLDQLVELAPGDPPGDVVIKPTEWRVLSRIERGRSLRQLLASGDGLWRTGQVLSSLIEAGLVRIGCPATAAPPEPRGVTALPSPLVDEIALLGDEPASANEPAAHEAAAHEADAPESDAEDDDELVDEPDLMLVTIDPADAEEDDDPAEVRRLAREELRDLSWDGEDAVPAGARAHRGRIIRLLSGDR